MDDVTWSVSNVYAVTLPAIHRGNELLLVISNLCPATALVGSALTPAALYSGLVAPMIEIDFQPVGARTNVCDDAPPSVIDCNS